MNTKKTRALLGLLLTALMLLLSACGQADGGSEAEEALLPVSVNGKEIRVGETTLQTLLDEGLDVSWVDENYNRVTVDSATQLEANAYYTGGSMKVTDNMSFTISLATEEAVPLGQAVIARLELNMAAEDDESVLETISFDGVPVTELTREKAGEMYPDWTGNEVMWLHYGLEYKYDLNFDISSGNLSGFTVERTYDVDWNS
ncbi:hypothetical protein [Oscillibacter sp. 1-3]|uniref:hypothetical protein n=1 Tax=Oscillibacter sp. 1-3 TaxID=1235797 RepID=UPI0003398B6B|nr:hypothetical protein [Oscillibacter sp. 1-3]EOS65670.1 hypothetical protein C816_02025 [Oscillibacter sp. 1-3]